MLATRKDARLSLRELFLYGFNYTVGITFIFGFSTLFNSQGLPKGVGLPEAGSNLGLHIIWMFFLNGLIALSISWAYARLIRVHTQKDGASYVFARTNNSFLLAWIVGAGVYFNLITAVTSQIVSAFRYNLGTDNDLFGAHWGSWTNLIVDLTATLVFIGTSCLMFLGFKKFKRFFAWSLWIQWILSFALVLIVFIVMLIHVGKGIDIYSDFNSGARTDIDFKRFSTNFIKTFYFFAGFEIYATLNKNLKNPRKDLPIAMALVMLATTLFYCFVIVCFLGTLTIEHHEFQKNPAFKLFGQLFGNKTWLHYLFAFAMVICFLSVKFSATMEGTLYANSIILPMVNDGYLPAVLEKDPKDNITNNTVKFYMASALTMYFFVVILVDIYQGSVDADDSPLDYSEIIGVATLIILPVYSLVLYLALKLSYTKHIKSSIFEMTAWGVTLFFFVVQAFKWFYDLFHNFTEHDQHKVFVSGLELALLVLILGSLLAVYYLYFEKSLKKDPTRAKKLRSKYLLHDDWYYEVAAVRATIKKTQQRVDSYLSRNKLVFANHHNVNYGIGEKLLAELKVVEQDYLVEKPESEAHLGDISAVKLKVKA